MATVVGALEQAGYKLTYDTRSWKVEHGGVVIGKGGFEEPRAFDPRSADHATRLTKQCAVWIAQRHQRDAQCEPEEAI